MKPIILTPYYGGVDLEHVQCVGSLIQRGWLQATISGCALLDHAFGALIGIALRQTERDMVLFLESDIVFAPEEAEALVATARDLDAMVGAPCVIKNPRGKLMCSGLRASEVRFGDNGKPEPCWGLPLGFTAIPLHRLRELVDYWCPEGPCRADNGGDVWPVFGCLVNRAADGHRELMTQDYSFCQRLDAVNCPRYLDTRRRVTHKGAYPYTVEDSCWSVPLVDDLRVRFVDAGNGALAPVASDALDNLDTAGATAVTPKSDAPSSCGTTSSINDLDNPISRTCVHCGARDHGSDGCPLGENFAREL